MDCPIQIYVRNPEEIEIEPAEVLRYLGYVRNHITEDDLEMVRELIPEARRVIKPRACFGRFPLTLKPEDVIVLPYGEIQSKDLTRNLVGCQEVYLFAATIGAAFDTLIKKMRLQSVAKACVMQSVGAAAVENFVEKLCAYLGESVAVEGLQTRPRYSPGYGDVQLANQRGIFQTLNPAKHVGITLMDTLIMAPEKSVTAYVGIKKA